MQTGKLLLILLAQAFVLFSQAYSQQQGTTPNAAPTQQIQWSNIAQMVSAPSNSYFFLEAKIRSVKAPDEGSMQPWVLYVEDNTGIARVVIFPKIWEEMEKSEQYEPGIIIQVYGKTNDYKEIRQLIAEGPKWIRLKPNVLQVPDRLKRGEQSTSNTKSDFLETSIGGINISAIGHNVAVRGIVKKVQPSERSRVPTKIILADSTGEIEVIYWSEVGNNLTYRNTPVEGRMMEFKGKVGEYRSVMQIVIDTPENVNPIENAVSMN
ncbi:MAG: hypothetical protein ACFCU1_10130 [Sumerlaeia bacterium]